MVMMGWWGTSKENTEYELGVTVGMHTAIATAEFSSYI